MSDLILHEMLGPVRRLTMNAPHNFNALSDAMIAALVDHLTTAGQAKDARAIILRGAGKAFCAGHDLKEVQAARHAADAGAAGFHDLFTRCAAMMQLIRALPMPVIAEVQGIATAAGCQLAASCDMVVAAEGTRFGVNGVNIGLFCSTPMVALSRAIPPKAAFEMLVTGEFITAERALALGLVNRVVPADRLSDTTLDLANTVARKLPAAISIGKRAFYAQLESGVAEAYAQSAAAMCENVLLADTDEGIAAFLEKRPPRWPGEI